MRLAALPVLGVLAAGAACFPPLLPASDGAAVVAEADPAAWPEGAEAAFDRGDLDAVARIAASGDDASHLGLRAAVAELRHDPEAMRALLTHPGVAKVRAVPALRLRLARAVYATLSLADARADFDGACAALPAKSYGRVEACSYAALAAAANGRRLVLSGAPDVEVDFHPNVSLPVVMASLEGRPPAPFIVDTGAASVALSRAWAEKSGIRALDDAARVTEDGGGSAVAIAPAWLDALDVGGLTARGHPAVVLTFPPQLAVAGILAPHHAFAGALVELDFRARKMRVRQRATLEEWARDVGEPVLRAPLTWEDGNIYVRGRVDAKLDGWMSFDTGAAGSVLTLEAVGRLGRTVDRKAETDSFSIQRHASFPAFDAAFAIAAGPAAPTSFTPIERRPTRSITHAIGNVGVTWMAGRRIAIAPDGRTLAYTEPEGAQRGKNRTE